MLTTLVVTVGTGSMDLYAHNLAENLNVPKLYTDNQKAVQFNIGRDSQEPGRAGVDFIVVPCK